MKISIEIRENFAMWSWVTVTKKNIKLKKKV